MNALFVHLETLLVSGKAIFSLESQSENRCPFSRQINVSSRERRKKSSIGGRLMYHFSWRISLPLGGTNIIPSHDLIISILPIRECFNEGGRWWSDTENTIWRIIICRLMRKTNSNVSEGDWGTYETSMLIFANIPAFWSILLRHACGIDLCDISQGFTRNIKKRNLWTQWWIIRRL